MDGLYLACTNNKFIWYARVSGWVQEEANAISLVRNACSLSALSFYIMTALSRHAFPGWCIRHGCSFSLLLGCYIAGAILIVVLIRHFHAGQSRPYSFICSIQSYSRFSLRAPMYFFLRYRLTIVIYISVIIGKVLYPELDENLFPLFLSLSLFFSFLLFLFFSFVFVLSLFICFSLSSSITSFVKLLYCEPCVVLILRPIRRVA